MPPELHQVMLFTDYPVILISFYSAINPPNKGIRSQEPDRPTQQPIHHTRHETITEKQQAGHKPLDMQPHEVIVNAVHEHPYGAGSADGKGVPPPIIVFGAELDIDCHDGDFGDGEHKDYGDNGKEPKDVVVAGFVLPHGLEDEEELDEDYSEGYEACEEDGLRGSDIPGLVGNLAGYCGCFGGVFPGACSDVTKP